MQNSRGSPPGPPAIDDTSHDVAARAAELTGGPVGAIAGLAGGHGLAAALGTLRPGGQIAGHRHPRS